MQEICKLQNKKLNIFCCFQLKEINIANLILPTDVNEEMISYKEGSKLAKKAEKKIVAYRFLALNHQFNP